MDIKKDKSLNMSLAGAALALLFSLSVGVFFLPFGSFSRGVCVLSLFSAFPDVSVNAAKKKLLARDGLAKTESDEAHFEAAPEAAEEKPVPFDDILPTESTQESVFADEAAAAAEIPAEARGASEELTYPSVGNGDGYFSYKGGYIKNGTVMSSDTLSTEAEKPVPFSVELDSMLPQVLIFHTHTTESFGQYDAPFYDKNAPVRSTDSQRNIVSVGEIIADELNAAGIKTLHATEYHDYPSFEGAYIRSADTVKGYLAKYPSIKVVLDVHRDGIERDDGTRIKPVTVINGEKTAQIMIVSNADDGTLGNPGYLDNLRFAARIQSVLCERYRGLARPVLFDYRDYNQFLSSGMLLVEVGSHGNTLCEAQHAAECFGRALAVMLRELGTP